MDTDLRAVASRPSPPAAPATSVAVEVARAVVATEIALVAVVVADRLLRRPPAPHVHVSMGPGGWVSVKGGLVGVRPGSRWWGRPRPVRTDGTHADAAAPWWARVLSAVPLQALSR
jgi:hypothetical protein